MHMVMWAMSDRAIPRSFRMMEGFGVHTFRLVNAEGESTFVKFHWRPTLGTQSIVWDEAVKINGADHDFHRRDLFDGDRDRRVSRVGASHPGFYRGRRRRASTSTSSTDQAHPRGARSARADRQDGAGPLARTTSSPRPSRSAFHPGQPRAGHRLHRRSAAAGPALLVHRHAAHAPRRAELPRDPDQPRRSARCTTSSATAYARMTVDPRAASATSRTRSLPRRRQRENPERGLRDASAKRPKRARSSAQRSETFADHYSQARHVLSLDDARPSSATSSSAFTFELAKVETIAIRTRMLGHLDIIDPELGARVADALGMDGPGRR